jgi:hypothetical protein
MAMSSSLAQTLWYEALMRNALAMAESCTDQQARVSLLRVAEGWALLAQPETQEREERESF